MSAENLKIKWHDHKDNLMQGLVAHLLRQHLADVTILCKGQYVVAHKLILSAGSSYFEELFKTEKFPIKSVVPLNNLEFEDIQCIITFLYHGEVIVAENCMRRFFDAANFLQVNGLYGDAAKSSPYLTNVTNNTITGTLENHDIDNVRSSSSTSVARHNEEAIDGKVELDKKKEQVVLPWSAFLNDVIDFDSTKKIKRPLNSFMMFAKERRKQIAQEFPEENNNKISTRLGEIWKNFSEQEKEKYISASLEANREHKLKYPDYKYNAVDVRNKRRQKKKQKPAELHTE